MGVSFRVKIGIINTIHNTYQIIGSCPNQSIQSFSVELCLNFFRIGLADCGNLICVHQTTL